MPVVQLPDAPGPQQQVLRVVDFGTVLEPPGGGVVQRINRPGTRWEYSVTLPPMPADQAQVWKARLARGVREGVMIAVTQPGFDPGAPGLPVVAGAGQAGSILALQGAAPNYRWREGQMLSVIAGGVSCLYQVASETVTAADGTAALALFPPLRAAPDAGSLVAVAPARLEGLLVGETEWADEVGDIVSIRFTIRERL